MRIDMEDLEQKYRKELASTLHIRIHSYEDRIARGVITFLSDQTVLPFAGLDQMCLLAEEHLIRIELFEAALTERRMICKGVTDTGWQEYLSGEAEKEKPEGSYCHKFVIRFLSRGSQSLQGELKVAGQRCCFRSGMELMRLMHQWLQVRCEPKNEKSLLLERGRSN